MSNEKMHIEQRHKDIDLGSADNLKVNSWKSKHLGTRNANVGLHDGFRDGKIGGNFVQFIDPNYPNLRKQIKQKYRSGYNPFCKVLQAVFQNDKGLKDD